MLQIIESFLKLLKEPQYNEELLRFAQVEFKKDWAYAYYKLLEGSYPEIK